MTKSKSFVSFLLCTCILLSGCSNVKYNDGEPLNQTINTTNPEPSAEQLKLNALRPMAYGNVEGLSLAPGSVISMIGKYADNSYWDEIEAGAKMAIDDINEMLDYEGSDKVTLTYNAPSNPTDVDEQINILDEELSRYPTAIAIAPIDAAAYSIQFDLAVDNQIPVITFDSGSNFPQVASHISTDNAQASKMAAEKLAEMIGGEGEIAVVVQDAISMTGKQRLDGFLNTISEQFPNINVVQTYSLDQLEEMKTVITAGQEVSEFSQEDVIKYILDTHPNLKAIYTANLDTTQLVTDVLSDYPDRSITCVGFDGGKEQLSLLEDGSLDGLIVQNPYGIGYATVVAAARASLGLGNESYVDSGYIWVTTENMNMTAIAGMLY